MNKEIAEVAVLNGGKAIESDRVRLRLLNRDLLAGLTRAGDRLTGFVVPLFILVCATNSISILICLLKY